MDLEEFPDAVQRVHTNTLKKSLDFHLEIVSGKRQNSKEAISESKIKAELIKKELIFRELNGGKRDQ